MKREMIVGMAMLTVSGALAQKITYPDTPRENTVDTYFGEQVADPYRWLENDTSARTAAWVEAENKLTQAYLKRIPMREKLLKSCLLYTSDAADEL